MRRAGLGMRRSTRAGPGRALWQQAYKVLPSAALPSRAWSWR